VVCAKKGTFYRVARKDEVLVALRPIPNQLQQTTANNAGDREQAGASMVKLDGSGMLVPYASVENVWKTPWLLAFRKFAPKNELLKELLAAGCVPTEFRPSVLLLNDRPAQVLQTGITANHQVLGST